MVTIQFHGSSRNPSELTEDNFTMLKHDVNGNPRCVCSWLCIPGAQTYADAIEIAHKIGGRKHHTKHFGGGIAFQGRPAEIIHDLKNI